jgi:hypothetical protein
MNCQKQSQTNPNQSHFQPAIRGKKSKQTQPVVSLSNQQSQFMVSLSNPNLPAAAHA